MWSAAFVLTMPDWKFVILEGGFQQLPPLHSWGRIDHKSYLFFLYAVQHIKNLNFLFLWYEFKKKIFLFSPHRSTCSTHLPLVLHICVSELGQHWFRYQAITWTNAGLLTIRPLGTNSSEIQIEIQNFSLMKMHLKMLSAKLAAILSRGRWVEGLNFLPFRESASISVCSGQGLGVQKVHPSGFPHGWS